MSGEADIRPPQATHDEPHWVVVSSVRRDKKVPFVEEKRGWRVLWRHATEERANQEALRLAEAHPGTRFSVYASGRRFRVEKAEASDVPPAGPAAP